APPTIALTSPLNGSTTKGNRSVNIVVSATDRAVLWRPSRSKVIAPYFRPARMRPLARLLGRERTLAQVPTPQVRLKSDDKSASHAAFGAIFQQWRSYCSAA